MKIYTVERMDKFDYDFSVELKKCGCFYDKKNALQKAKEVYESMCGEYKDGMARYADEEDEASGKTRIEEDTENGYYLVAFGFEEHYECHSVAVEEYEIEDELSHWEKRNVYDELHENYLIEDIKCKLEEMEDYTATNEDLKSIAYKAQKTLDNNDYYWDSYWCTLENVIEDYFREA